MNKWFFLDYYLNNYLYLFYGNYRLFKSRYNALVDSEFNILYILYTRNKKMSTILELLVSKLPPWLGPSEKLKTFLEFAVRTKIFQKRLFEVVTPVVFCVTQHRATNKLNLKLRFVLFAGKKIRTDSTIPNISRTCKLKKVIENLVIAINY